ncbi:hypothetical protein ANME2D_02743 [Candidatus Methanoperedens nitroreducens]|uniref:Actinobacteria/chloroflexi VLRF1 release factor domain-containing protein n=1 Tax=Candidatus Methanoperedens nitratireducens TaxID=1392998 RepID=A0A062V4G2_9EURY|nr:Vms1/Ankzf1 family peptidyl-tRNA hydrolase [Candidatus Methanoperedens nitroreducens]KCZ70719.1 hypothetical protein ANME2D_02743 [Candidatus Methanoperedens nitroreducens]MDJ1420574.1 Vms1/Ankzf1 family peptidyl-tRNA hydrolase [Candidatus Methanoperedens sp.]
MFDLFKKDKIESLQARITQLEEENKKLLLQLEKKSEKTKRTIATKQEVDRELNEARQRISSLENEVQRLKEESSGELNFHFSESLSRNKLENVLFLLESLQSKTSTLITIYLARDDILKNIISDIEDQIESSALYLIEKIDSQTGKVIFYDTIGIVKLVVIPVFPVSHSEYSLDRRFNIEPLKNSLISDKVLVINAHAGETFIGILEQDTFVEHDIVRSSVMGKHSKGGWSQKRFQSLVEEDIRHHADKVRAALGTIIEKHKDIQYVIAGGEGKLIRMILEGYDYPLIINNQLMDYQPEKLLKEIMSVRMYGL